MVAIQQPDGLRVETIGQSSSFYHDAPVLSASVVHRGGVTVPGYEAARHYALNGSPVEHCEGSRGQAKCIQHPEDKESLSCLLHHVSMLLDHFSFSEMCTPRK